MASSILIKYTIFKQTKLNAKTNEFGSNESSPATLLLFSPNGALALAHA